MEVLRRRPESISVPVSHRNSAYIPAKSPSQSSLCKESSLASTQTEAVPHIVHPSGHDHPHVVHPGGHDHPHVVHPAERDHDFLDEEDELLEEHDVDLLVPGLDYEVSFYVLYLQFPVSSLV